MEAGGTKFVCGIGTGPDDLETASFPTSTPDITLHSVVDFFTKRSSGALQAVGVGSFGPVDLDPHSPAYGHITSTPKVGWEDFDLAGSIRRGLNVPVRLDTDVNAALLGEARWGAARGLKEAVYLTIGTGIGGGILAHGEVIHGMVHPEIGHLAFAPRPRPRSIPWHLPVSRRLSRRPGLRSGHAGALGAAGVNASARSSGVAFGGALPGTGRHEFDGHGFAVANSLRRRSHAAAAVVPHAANGICTHHERLHSPSPDSESSGRIPAAARRCGGRAGVLGSLVLAEMAR